MDVLTLTPMGLHYYCSLEQFPKWKYIIYHTKVSQNTLSYKFVSVYQV